MNQLRDNEPHVDMYICVYIRTLTQTFEQMHKYEKLPVQNIDRHIYASTGTSFSKDGLHWLHLSTRSMYLYSAKLFKFKNGLF